jgi:hypothetical protein
MPNYVALPLIGNTSRGVDFISTPLWICLGRTTPWPDEENPPIADPNTTNITEPIIYKRCEVQSFVVEDPQGEYIVSGVRYRPITIAQARATMATTILIKATILDNDVGDEVTFRQVGLYSKLIPTPGNEPKTKLLPNEVQDPGYLEWFANREPIHIQPNQHEIFYIVLNF